MVGLVNRLPQQIKSWVMRRLGSVAASPWRALPSSVVQFNGKERPWTALAVGTLPAVGNFAFPIQILRSSRGKDDHLARFLLYDGLAQFGALVPIWGGQDTLTEHRLNRLADRIVRRR